MARHLVVAIYSVFLYDCLHTGATLVE